MIKKIGDKIVIQQVGGEAQIVAELGKGGQGTVFKVIFSGKEYALKWYHKPQEQNFYKNLQNNITQGAPNDSFLWPLFLTEKDKDGCFGYLMNLRDAVYKDFSSFLLAKTSFGSTSAMVEAALNICISFRELHSKGYSYQDLNDGNFFINPQTGDVLICDNDNVAPFGVQTGILGKCRYMAPEIITRKNLPNAQSDRFSLSVILFLLFFNNHPLEGELITACPCMTEKHEKKFYGSSPVFIYNPTDASNRPVRGIHTNVIQLWSLFPQYVRDAFIKQFSKEILHNPQARQTEKEWINQIILRMRNELVICPFCKEEQFADIHNNSIQCLSCKKTFTRPPIISSGNNQVVVYAKKPIYEYITNNHSENYKQQTGIVVESNKTPGLFAIRNQTNDTWILRLRDGSSRPVKPDEPAPLIVGYTISFGNGHFANII